MNNFILLSAILFFSCTSQSPKEIEFYKICQNYKNGRYSDVLGFHHHHRFMGMKETNVIDLLGKSGVHHNNYTTANGWVYGTGPRDENEEKILKYEEKVRTWKIWVYHEDGPNDESDGNALVLFFKGGVVVETGYFGY